MLMVGQPACNSILANTPDGVGLALTSAMEASSAF